MATQSSQLIETNSPQLEASLNPTQDFGTRIRSIIFDAPAFKDVEEYKAAFSKAENGAHEAAKKKFNAEADMILHIAMVQSFLSERGVNAELRKAAGIKPGFGEWYETFRAKYDVEYAFKTIQHKIAQLRGGCEHCGRLADNDADHKKSCVRYRPLIAQAEPGEMGGGNTLDMKAATNAHYADRYLALIGLLTNAPAGAKPEEVFATMRAEAEAAYEELDAETAAKIKVPKLAKADSAAKGLQSKLDEQEILLNHRDVEIRGLEEKFARIKEENDALSDIVDNFEERLAVLGEIPENLRDENITSSLAKEPDIDEANRTLGAYVRTVVNRMLPPTMAIDGTVWVSAARVGRDHRIMPGDWLRFVPGKGESPRLCQCVGEKEYLHRRVVREWVDGRWEKEHIVNGRDESCYRVISEPAARALVAEAFPKEAL